MPDQAGEKRSMHRLVQARGLRVALRGARVVLGTGAGEGAGLGGGKDGKGMIDSIETAPFAEMGKRLREMRLGDRRTMKEQAALLGVSLNSVFRWENGYASPRRAALDKLCELHGVGADLIMVQAKWRPTLTATEAETRRLRSYRTAGPMVRMLHDNIDKMWAAELAGAPGDRGDGA
jgi:transcriptional regulator with XRE-family HTH domain